MAYKNIEDRKAYHKRWYYLNKTKRIKQISAYNLKKHRELKRFLVDLLGGKCSICGYNKCLGALDFHHKGYKERAIGELIQNNNKSALIKEAKKCDLLCSNCHREKHYLDTLLISNHRRFV
jgi:5-methylcytosine-specific restriction endonuclease McrA